MSAEEREIRLTAYALGDPGVSAEECAEVEREVAADAGLQKQVNEVRELAKLLTAGLAAEVAATPSLSVPSSVVPRRGSRARWLPAAVALLTVVGVGLSLLPGRTEHVSVKSAQIEMAARRPVPTVAFAKAPGNELAGAPFEAAARASRDEQASDSKSDLGRQSGAAAMKDQQSEHRAMNPTKPASGQADSNSPSDQPKGAATQALAGVQLDYAQAKPADAGALRQKQEQLKAMAAPPAGEGFGGSSAGSGLGAPGGLSGGVMPGQPGNGSGGYGPGGPPVSAPKPAGFGYGGVYRAPGFMPSPSALPLPAVARGRVETESLRKLNEPLARIEPGLMHPSDNNPAGKPELKLLGDHDVAGIARRGLIDYHAGDQFPATVENAFTPVAGQDALSTFGVDVDTASYAITRNYLARGALPPANAVRLEEIVNYFPYQDKPPTGDDPFAVTVELAACPWNSEHKLARIGLKARPIDADKRPPSNLVFLLDVSGSMGEPNKLPLVIESMKLLVNQLGENDRVAIVVYAGASGLVLDSTSVMHKAQILESLTKLQAGGSTNGAGGIQQAYDVAQKHFIKNGTNRVVLCTDGDFNVGTTSTEALVQLIEDKRKTGVFLSVFGFGMGNLRDEMMVKLAGKGNGNYGYIDTLREANKALVEQLAGTLVTVAKDVKIQVEFNPATVKAYRLLGYEKRVLEAKDFADDKKDAGEMGAGHTVTCLYELVPADGTVEPKPGENLRYQPAPKPATVAAKPVAKPNEAFVVKMRHKKPDGDVSLLRELPVANVSKSAAEASEDFRFAAAAAEFALVLRDSPYKGSATLAGAAELAGGAMSFDPSGYRAEFIELLKQARRAAPGK